MRIEFKTDTKSGYQRPSHSKVFIISLISISQINLWIEATELDPPLEPSGPLMDSSEEEDTTDSKLRTEFKQTKHRNKWLVTHLNFNEKLDVLYAYFIAGQVRSGSDRYYQSEVVLSSALLII